MSRAEERAKEAFPKSDWFNENRSAYIEGYKQAEQDLTDKAKFSSGWDGFFYGRGYYQAKQDYIEYAQLWVDSGEVNIKSFKQFLKDRGYE